MRQAQQFLHRPVVAKNKNIRSQNGAAHEGRHSICSTSASLRRIPVCDGLMEYLDEMVFLITSKLNLIIRKRKLS